MPDYDWRFVSGLGADLRWKWCTTFDVEFLNSRRNVTERLYEPSSYTHRDDGPLYMALDGSYIWVWQGLLYSFNEWCKMADVDDVSRAMLVLQYA